MHDLNHSFSLEGQKWLGGQILSSNYEKFVLKKGLKFVFENFVKNGRTTVLGFIFGKLSDQSYPKKSRDAVQGHKSHAICIID